MSAAHRIRRQELLIRVPDQTAARRLQARAMQALHAAGPRMEPVLDRYGPSHDYLRIDRLVLDLGILSPEELETGLLERLPGALAEALDAVAPLHRSSPMFTEGSAAEKPRRQTRASALDRGNGSDERPRAASRPEPNLQNEPGTGVPARRPEAIQLSERERILQAVLGFLETGRLPWWSTTLPKEAGKSLFQAATDEPAVVAALLRLLIRSPEDLLPRLVELVGRGSSRDWARSQITSEILAALESAIEVAGWPPDREGLQLLLAVAIGMADTEPDADGLAQVLGRLFPATALTGLRRQLSPISGAHTRKKPPDRIEALSNALKKAIGGAAANARGVEPHGSAQEPPPSKRMQPFRDSTSMMELVYLKGAGGVLLHPFLLPLFQALKLSDATDFRNGRARERATRLLEFLVWGDSGRPEYELVLEKHLCSMAPEIHLGRLELKPGEREEGDRMLSAVIGHWKALKSTSPSGLREGFLQREGRLDLGGDEQVLRVSPAPQDVLLGALPWPVSNVRLPWMGRPLRVEWGT